MDTIGDTIANGKHAPLVDAVRAYEVFIERLRSLAVEKPADAAVLLQAAITHLVNAELPRMRQSLAKLRESLERAELALAPAAAPPAPAIEVDGSGGSDDVHPTNPLGIN